MEQGRKYKGKVEEVDVATCGTIRTNYLSPCEKGARQIKKTVDEKNTKTGTQQKLVLLKVISVDITFVIHTVLGTN